MFSTESTEQMQICDKHLLTPVINQILKKKQSLFQLQKSLEAPEKDCKLLKKRLQLQQKHTWLDQFSFSQE